MYNRLYWAVLAWDQTHGDGQCLQFIPLPKPTFDIKNKESVYKAVMEIKTNCYDSLNDEQRIQQISGTTILSRWTYLVMWCTLQKFSPPGHWMNIVVLLHKTECRFRNHRCCLFETAIALFDAFISCWDEKYRTILWGRKQWSINTLIPTGVIYKRPFIHQRGHAAISAAAAEATSGLRDQLSFADTSSLEFRIKSRQIKTFRGCSQRSSHVEAVRRYPLSFRQWAWQWSWHKTRLYIVQRLRMKNRKLLFQMKDNHSSF